MGSKHGVGDAGDVGDANLGGDNGLTATINDPEPQLAEAVV